MVDKYWVWECFEVVWTIIKETLKIPRSAIGVENPTLQSPSSVTVAS